LGMAEDRLSDMVSFQAADAVERAQEDARQQALGVYSGPRYPSLAGKDEAPSTEEEDEEVEVSATSMSAAPDELPAFLREEEVATPTPTPAATPTPTPAPAPERPVPTTTTARPQTSEAPVPQQREMPQERPPMDAKPVAPKVQVATGLDSSVGTLGLVGAALLVVVLFIGSAYMGGQRLQAGQQRADVTRAKLYNAIALDEHLVRDMVDLGADGTLLQQRYQQYAIAKEPQKARRALALSRALDSEIKGTRVGSVRARQLEQVVQHIGSARITYTHSVEEWASATRGLVGGLAMTIGFGEPPASDAILPLE